MKKRRLFAANMAIVLGMSLVTMLYVRSDNAAVVESQRRDFLTMTEGLSQVTANYLASEQFVCDTWAAYINSHRLSMQEALDFTRISRPKHYSTVHIIYIDDGSFAGFSVDPKVNDKNEYAVSYSNIPLFSDIDSSLSDGGHVNITRTYTNPMNGVQSIAFYSKVALSEEGHTRDALLMRIIPVQILHDGWIFPTDRYNDVQISLIEFSGGYIIKEPSFKNSNFFEFYKSYNQDDFNPHFQDDITGTDGTAAMHDSHGTEIMIAHAIVNSTGGWIMLAGVPMTEIAGKPVNWVLTLLLSLGLALLFAFNVAMLIAYNRQLSLTAEAADAANKAKSNFLSVMSHDIRTPINAVLGLDEMVLRESNDETIRSYASDIQSSGKMLLALINDILDFSKIEAGKMEIISAEYDFAAVVADLVNIIQSRADAKGLSFTVNVDETMPSQLRGDDTRIKQCALNLLTNAVKYTHSGGVTLNISFCREDDTHVLITVHVLDTGIGIKAEDIEKLCSPFQRIEESRNRNIEGTGLGMSIVKSLLSAMGSQLVVKSDYGKGSDFSFTVRQEVLAWEPIGDWRAAHRESAKSAVRYTESFQAPDAKILVVDDTPMNLTVVKGLLKATRIQIETAADAMSALEKAHDTPFNIILADHLMPQMGGLEMLQKLRADTTSVNQHTVCIALTANAVSGAREMYIEAGFSDYLTKPVDSAKLEAMLAKYLPEQLMLHSGDDGYKAGGSSPAADTGAADPLVREMFALDSGAALRNCGSAETFIEAVRNFHEVIGEKSAAIEAFAADEAWKDYTILVHALKSSARLIGAAELSAQAAELEQHGNEAQAGDAAAIAAIREKTPALLEAYRAYIPRLAPLCKPGSGNTDDRRPEIPAAKLAEALAALREVLVAFDFGTADAIIAELDGFAMPSAFAPTYTKIRAAVRAVDQSTALSLL